MQNKMFCLLISVFLCAVAQAQNIDCDYYLRMSDSVLEVYSKAMFDYRIAEDHYKQCMPSDNFLINNPINDESECDKYKVKVDSLKINIAGKKDAITRFLNSYSFCVNQTEMSGSQKQRVKNLEMYSIFSMSCSRKGGVGELAGSKKTFIIDSNFNAISELQNCKLVSGFNGNDIFIGEITVNKKTFRGVMSKAIIQTFLNERGENAFSEEKYANYYAEIIPFNKANRKTIAMRYNGFSQEMFDVLEYHNGKVNVLFRHLTKAEAIAKL